MFETVKVEELHVDFDEGSISSIGTHGVDGCME